MKEENQGLGQIISSSVCGILMILSIISYLLVGFLANLWHPGWLIIVCAALICGIVGIVGNMVTSLKLFKSKKDE